MINQKKDLLIYSILFNKTLEAETEMITNIISLENVRKNAIFAHYYPQFSEQYRIINYILLIIYLMGKWLGLIWKLNLIYKNQNYTGRYGIRRNNNRRS